MAIILIFQTKRTEIEQSVDGMHANYEPLENSMNILFDTRIFTKLIKMVFFRL